MSDTWPDEFASEDVELLDGEELEEDYDEGEDDTESYGLESPESDEYGEGRRYDVRRARAQRAAVYRARAVRDRARARARRRALPRPRTPAAAVRRTQAAVLDLDAQSKVQADAFTRALNAQSRRIDRGHAALVATTVERQLAQSFKGVGDSKFLAPVAKAAPLLLLPTSRRRNGLGALTANPHVLGIGLIVGLAVAAEMRSKSEVVENVRFDQPPTALVRGDKGFFRAKPLDAKGNVITDKVSLIKFESTNSTSLKVDADGAFEALAAGRPQVRAELDGKVDVTTVGVTDA